MNLLEDLKERLNKKRVVVIVGAGVSIAASGGQRVASWKGLLDAGIEQCIEIVRRLPEVWAERHIETACEAWQSIDRPDLVEELDEELGLG